MAAIELEHQVYSVHRQMDMTLAYNSLASSRVIEF